MCPPSYGRDSSIPQPPLFYRCSMHPRPHRRFNLDVTPVRAEGSLAVTQGLVVAVYDLNLVEASSAIYVIHALGVARVDTVVAVASVHLVVAVAGDDLVVAVATPEAVVAAVAFEAVLPAASREAVLPVGPTRASSPPVAVRTFARASCPAKNAPNITTITVSK